MKYQLTVYDGKDVRVTEDSHLNVLRGKAQREIKRHLLRSDMPSVKLTPYFDALFLIKDVFNNNGDGLADKSVGYIQITAEVDGELEKVSLF